MRRCVIKRFIAIGLISLTVLGVTACKKKDSPSGPDGKTPNQTATYTDTVTMTHTTIWTPTATRTRTKTATFTSTNTAVVGTATATPTNTRTATSTYTITPTATATLVCVGTVVYGHTDGYGSGWTLDSNNIRAVRIPLTGSPISITGVLAACQGGGSCQKIKVGIYSDGGTAPVSLLTQGSAFLTSTSGVSIFTIDVPDIRVSSRYVWIAALGYYDSYYCSPMPSFLISHTISHQALETSYCGKGDCVLPSAIYGYLTGYTLNSTAPFLKALWVCK